MNCRSPRTISLVTVIVLAAIGVAVGQTGMAQLVNAAKQEGELTVIALPRDWCGYGELIDSYKQKYSLKVNELNPTPARVMRSRPSRPTRATRAPRRRT